MRKIKNAEKIKIKPLKLLSSLKPLFLSVTCYAYGWYLFHDKSYEIRPYGRFNERTAFKGRNVVVSKGYVYGRTSHRFYRRNF